VAQFFGTWIWHGMITVGDEYCTSHLISLKYWYSTFRNILKGHRQWCQLPDCISITMCNVL